MPQVDRAVLDETTPACRPAPAWLRYWIEVFEKDGPPPWYHEVPEHLRAWLESFDDVSLCWCPGVAWQLNYDPTTSKPCPKCGKLRNDGRCVVYSKNRNHRREGCRSVDTAHVRRLILVLETQAKALNFAIDMSDLASGRRRLIESRPLDG